MKDPIGMIILLVETLKVHKINYVLVCQYD